MKTLFRPPATNCNSNHVFKQAATAGVVLAAILVHITPVRAAILDIATSTDIISWRPSQQASDVLNITQDINFVSAITSGYQLTVNSLTIQSSDPSQWRTINYPLVGNIFEMASFADGTYTFDKIILTGANNTNTAGWARGGALRIANTGLLTIHGDFQVIGNAARGGGGIYRNASGGLLITGALVLNNNKALTTNEGGGGMRLEAVTTLEKTLQADGNESAIHGGAIRASANFTLLGGGSITNNRADGTGRGGGIYFETAATLSLGTQLEDMIFQGNVQGTAATPNAIYLATAGATLELNATSGRAIRFYDPIQGGSGVITVRKTGAGEVLFDRYSSDIIAVTTVEEGGFRLSNEASYGRNITTGTFTVRTGASLEGSGTINAATVTIQDGATLRPWSATDGGALTLNATTRSIGQSLLLAGRGTLSTGVALHASSITAEDGGTLVLADAVTLADSGTLAGNGSVAVNAGLTMGATPGSGVVANIASGNLLNIIGNINASSPAALTKTGGGILRLAGNNAGYTHAMTVSEGGLLFAGTLGAASVTAAPGAIFGGEGTMTGSVSIGAGGTLQVGSLDATTAEELIIEGPLTLGENATVAVSLTKGGELGVSENSKVVLPGGLVLAGSSTTYTINLLKIRTGTFDIGDLSDLAGLDQTGHSDDAKITLNGVLIGGRQNASITGSDGRLILTADAGLQQIIRWNGSSPVWDYSTENWNAAGGTLPFADGDHVIFDSVTDLGNEASRAEITIAPSRVTVSGMEITGSASYRFTGGAIESDKDSVSDESAQATKDAANGKLMMRSTGTLTLANTTGANNFKEGVDLEAGTLVLASLGALGNSNVNITGSNTEIHFGLSGISVGGSVSIGNHTAIIDAKEFGATIAGAITGGGTLITRSGAGGSLTLSGTTNVGLLLVENGTLIAGAPNIFGGIDNIEIATGATLDLRGNAQTVKKLSGEGTVSIASATLLTVNAGENMLFAGTMAGDGALLKTGTGMLTLIGANTHKGGTLISSGTLAVTRLAALGVGVTQVAPGVSTALVLDGVSGTHLYNITGGGRVEINSSTLTLGGTNSLGALNLHGASVVRPASASALGGPSSSIAVNAGSTLLLDVAGVVVTGSNLSVANGATLQYSAFSSAAQADNKTPGGINLSGTLLFEDGATLGIAITVPSGTYSVAQAAGGITGMPEYEQMQSGWRALTVSVENNNTLALTIVNLAADPARAATMTFDSMVAVTNSVYSRVSENFLVPLTARKPRDKANNLWLKGIASYAKYDTTAVRLGHTENTYGGVLGYDGNFRDRFVLGVYGGWLQSRLETDNDAITDADQSIAGIYTAYRYKWFYIGADVGFGWVDADTSRFEGVDFARGSYSVETKNCSLETGFVIDAWKGGVFKPMATVHVMNATFKNYKEDGPGALRMSPFSDVIVQSFAALQVSQKFQMLRKWPSILDVAIGWRQNHKEFDADVSASFAATPTSTVVFEKGGYSRGSAVVRLGFRAALTRQVSMGLSYDYEVTMDRDRHTANFLVQRIW